MKKETNHSGFYRSWKKILLKMKLTAILFLIGLVSVSASSYSQTKLNITYKGNSFVELMNEIEQKSEFYFFYQKEDLTDFKEIFVNAKNLTVAQILDDVLEGSSLEYKIIDRYIIIKKNGSEFPDSSTILQQQREVTGKVVDESNQPVPGVSVVVIGTTQGTVTNIDGEYSLKGVPEDATLRFSFIGMRTQEVPVEGKNIINVTMGAETIGIEEVVAVAYGTMKKKDLTGSISTISNDRIEAQAASTITKTLEGAVPGIQVSSVDGQPGWDMGVRLRGLGSTNQTNSDALVVIDGVPAQGDNPLSTINPKDIESVTVLKDAASSALYGSRGSNGVLLITTKKGKKGDTKISFQGRWGVNQIGPYEYDKISKPADIYEYAWLSIYNDVRYSSGSHTDYTTNFQNPNMTHDEAAAFASAHLFDYTGSTDASSFQRNDLGNWMLYDVPGAVYTTTGAGTSAGSTMSGAYLINTDGKINPDARLLYNDTYDKYLLETKFRQEYNISARGGTDKMDYYLSLGYLEDPSYVRNSRFNRYSGRANINAKLYDWLKVGTNVAYSWRETQQQATRYGRNPGTSSQNIFYWLSDVNPLWQLYAHDENGDYIYEDGEKVRHVEEGDTYSPLGYTSTSSYDLLYMLDHNQDITKSSDIITRSYAEIKLMEGLKFTNTLGFEKYHSTRTRYFTPVTGRESADNGGIGKLYQNITILNTQQLLSYEKKIGSGRLDVLAGHEFDRYYKDYIQYGSAYGLLDDYVALANFVGHYSNSGNTKVYNPGGGETAHAMESYLARVNYEYAEKYYLEGSIRVDGSSKFKETSNRWGTFGSVGFGWRVSSESFMESTKSWLNNLKFRTSFGIIGNQNGVGDYANYQTWSYAASSYTSATNGKGVPAGYKLTKGTYKPSITWEKARVFDIGIDYSIMDFIHGTLDYYNKYTYDGLWAKPIASSLGQSSIQSNDAELSNRGFEIELTLDLIKNRDWFWSVTFNGTHYNTILEYIPEGVGSDDLDGCFVDDTDSWSTAGSGTSSNGCYLRGVGKDYYNMYVYRYAGVDQSTGLPLLMHKVTSDDHSDGLYTGYEVGETVNTTDYSQASKYEVGDAIPDWIGGFSTTLRYKSFDFSTIIAYQLGGKFYSTEYGNGLYRSGDLGRALSAELLGNTFTADNTDAKFPMVFYNGGAYTDGTTFGSWKYTDMALFSASYMNLKNITIGYNVPKSFLTKYWISNMRLYVSADNLFMVTSHSGIDPRMSLVGGFEVGASAYPTMRTISFGIDLDL